MKKRILSLVLAAVLCLLMLSGCGSSDSAANVASSSRSGVVRLLTFLPTEVWYDEDGAEHVEFGVATGSAFGVGTVGEATDVFVTNAHVVQNDAVETPFGTTVLPASNVYILLNDQAVTPVGGFDYSQMIPCKVLYVTSGSNYPDYAIIRATQTPPGRVALPLLADDADIDIGDSVYALGYPASTDESEGTIYGEKLVADVDDVTVTSGVISRFADGTAVGNTRSIQHDAQINHGNSGGPLINTDGAVIGINTYGIGADIFDGDEASYYAVEISYVKDTLDSLGIDYEVYSESLTWLYVLIGAVAVLAVIAVLFVVLRKKGRQGGADTGGGRSGGSGGMELGDLRIQGISGVFAGKRFALTQTLRLGRDPNRNDIVYPANTQGVSGVHCMLTFDPVNGQLYIKDLGSTFGTVVNRTKRLAASQPMALKVGDQFWVGSENECFMITRKGGVV